MQTREIAAAISAMDFGDTSLGPITAWPERLTHALELCLRSDFPTAIFWGNELAFLYNDAFRSLLGADHRSMLGRPLRELELHAETRQLAQVLQPLLKSLAGRDTGCSIPPQRLELDGATRWFRFSATPIGAIGADAGSNGDGAHGVLATAFDDTDHVVADLEEREQTLAVIAHDLKNPLNVISLSAYQLRSLPATPQIKERLEKQIDAIKRSTRRINDLISDVLDLARLDLGALSLDAERQDASTLVREALDVVAPATRPKAINVTSEVEPELAVLCDRERTVRVLAGVLLNAIAASPESTTVELSVRRDGECILFEVRDRGVGIAEEERRLVFDRQLHKRRGDKKKLGRGLPLAKGLLAAEGGRIWLESEPGKGTAVSFTLPAAT